MIELLMSFYQDYVLIKIRGNSIEFGNTAYGSKMATIDNMKLDKSGVCKEFPELKDNPLWREEAIKRFKDKISLMDKEKDIADYLLNDLKKFGYIPLYLQEQGKRRVKL